MTRLTKVVLIAAVAAVALGVIAFQMQESPCESDPRSRDCFETMVEAHFGR